MINVFKPHVNIDECVTNLIEALSSGWIGLGPKTKEFETKLAEYWGVKAENVIAVQNATAGLHLAVKSLDLSPGSKVITTPLTFVATNHALLYEGLEPVFADVEASSGNISVNSIEYLIEKHDIKAIMVVHLGGYPCDMEKINRLGLPVIEDCAHAMGAVYENGNKVGNSKNICVFSFHAVKNMPCGEGGAVVVPEDNEYFRKARWMGINQDTYTRSENKGYKWNYDVEFLGYKYHMSDIYASIGLANLPELDNDNYRRADIVEMYKNGIKGVEFPFYSRQRQSSYHFYPVFFDNVDETYQKLVQAQIYPGMHYRRNDEYPIYRNCKKASNMFGTKYYCEHELTLPLHCHLTDEEVNHIIDTVNS